MNNLVIDGAKVSSVRVGTRWFTGYACGVDENIFDIVDRFEATYSIKDQYWPNSADHGKRVWTITGSGSRKYREQIIAHLEGKYFDGNSKTKNDQKSEVRDHPALYGRFPRASAETIEEHRMLEKLERWKNDNGDTETN